MQGSAYGLLLTRLLFQPDLAISLVRAAKMTRAQPGWHTIQQPLADVGTR